MHYKSRRLRQEMKIVSHSDFSLFAWHSPSHGQHEHGEAPSDGDPLLHA